MVEERSYRLLVAKPEENNTLRSLRHRKDTNIKKDVKKMECEGADWSHVT
jgi:hypothetical protein